MGRDGSTDFKKAKLWNRMAAVLAISLLLIGAVPVNIVSAEEIDESPTLTILAPDKGTLYNVKSVTVKWSGVCVTPAQLDHYELRVDESSWLNMKDATEYTTPSLSEGAHSVTVRIIDTNGLNDTVTVPFVIDSIAPTVHITAPLDGAILSVDNCTMEWVAGDTGSGIESYLVGIDGRIYASPTLEKEFIFPSLAEGTHTLKVIAIDAAGNSASDSISITIDTTAPTVNVVTPSDKSFHTGDTVKVAWASKDGISSVERSIIQVDDGIWVDLGSATEYFFTTKDRDPHTLTVRVFDMAGNVASASVTVTMNVDMPYIHITSPTEGAVIGSDNLQLKWSSTLGTQELDHYEISVDGQGWYSVGKYLQVPIEDLTEGRHQLSVRVVCEGGMMNEAIVNITVDTSYPEIDFINIDKSIFNNPEVPICWTRAGSSASYSLLIDNGTWIELGDVTEYTTHPLCDGFHNVVLKASYPTGKSSSVEASFRVDTEAPTMMIISPVARMFDRNHDIDIEWSSVDKGTLPTGVAYTELSIDGGQWFSVGKSSSFVLNLTKDGWHMIVIRSHDVAGNNAELSIKLYIDTSAPTVDITAPGEGAILRSNNVTLSWSSSDPTGTVIKSILRLDNGPQVILEHGSGSFVFHDVPDGEHVLTAWVFDMAGNDHIDSVTFTVDTTPPELMIISPSDGSHIGNTDVTVAWDAYDLVGFSHYAVRIDDAWEPVGDTNSILLGELDDGTYTVGVIAYDLAGNSVLKSVTFTVDTTPPEVVTYGPIDNDSRLSVSPFVELSEKMGTIMFSISSSKGHKDIVMCDVKNAVAEIELLPSTQYSIEVSGRDLAGNPLSPISWSFTTASTGAPGMVVSPEAYLDDEGIILRWHAPHDDGGYSITGYEVYRILGSEHTWVANITADEYIYMDSDLESGKKYKYAVAAVNEWGRSELTYSNEVSTQGSNWYGIILLVILAALLSAAAFILWSRKRRDEQAPIDRPMISEESLPEQSISLPAPMAEPKVEPIASAGMDDDTMRAIEHSRYLRQRMAELKASLASREIDEDNFRVMASQIMTEIMDINRALFHRLGGDKK